MVRQLDRPQWLNDPDERSKWIKTLAEQGVSRGAIRSASGYRNNQMAGAANRAGVVFKNYQTKSPAEMRIALQNAGFAKDIAHSAVESALAAPQKRIGTTASKPRAVGTKSSKKKPSRRRRGGKKVKGESPDLPLEPNVPPTVVQDAEKELVPDIEIERAEPPTLEQVNAEAERVIRKAASDAKALEEPTDAKPVPVPSPSIQPQTTAPPPKSKRTAGCQWPMGPGAALNTIATCDDPLKDGDERFCPKHRTLVNKYAKTVAMR